MLQAYALGQVDPCADDPCSSPSCPDYDAEICAQLASSDVPGSCGVDSDCPSGQTCNVVSAFCEPLVTATATGGPSPGTQVTPSPGVAPAAAASPAAAAAAALPKPTSNKLLIALLAIAGVAGIGAIAYGRMKRAPKT